tara:strand:+ start:1482 stop:4151 length:2670 start_codon:yes stop_codon:yes gene_type:complete
MSARRHLHLLLVASLIVILFALAPAKAEEDNLNIVAIEHLNSKEQNNINIQIENYDNSDINCNLMISIYSEDLTEELPLTDTIAFFSIDSNSNYIHNFSFTIPNSGKYTFNLSLLTESDDIVQQYFYSEKFTFYDYEEYELENLIVDYYYDPGENANWIYYNEKDTIELKNIEDSYDTGIVLGPFDTLGHSESIISLRYQSEKTNSADYTISITTEFNSSEIYGTEWVEVHTIDLEEEISLEIPIDSKVFVLLRGKDINSNSENFWELHGIHLEKLTIKHSLSIYSQPNYFFGISEKGEFNIEIENIGTFDQQLGNVSIVAKIYNQNGIIGSYASLPSIESGDSQTIVLDIDEILEPGHYFLDLKTTIIDNNLFFEENTYFISVSNYNYGQIDIDLTEEQNTFTIETENNEIEILLHTEGIDELNISAEYSIVELTNNHYVIRIVNDDGSILMSTESQFKGEIISLINMDEVKYSIINDSTIVSTIEGITAPSVIFDDGNEKTLTIGISNEGFYKESYSLNYIYSSTFISSIEGISTIEIEPNTVEYVEIKVDPLQNIPREGGSQFNIEISNNNENKIITYVFGYLNPTIEISEIKCDRYALLIGQDLKCTTILTNRGYLTEDLTFIIFSETSIIEEVNINSLDFLETWTLTTTYEPSNIGETNIFVNVITDEGVIFDHKIESEVKVISSENTNNNQETEIKIPEINAGRSIVLLTIAGILYQINRSENLKYLGLKFFFIPMYSRLQKDTLTDEPTRQKLLKYIYSEPGANFKQLKDKFSLHNGTLAHHINILENHDIITSHRSGRQRLFFPMGINQEISRVSLVTNETQRNIMDIVKNTPGITQSMISQQLGISRQKVNYHVNSLVDKAFLKIEKQGRITRLYPLYYT